MAVTIGIVFTDDAPPDPFTEPIIATTAVSTPGMADIVMDDDTLNPALLQSYLMMAVEPVVAAYAEIIASPPVMLMGAAAAPGDDTTLPEPEPRPPLETTTAVWVYQKPELLVDPGPGAVVHAASDMATLRFSRLDNDAVDHSEMMSLVNINDTIALGTTVWTVTATGGGLDWVDFTVTPSTQDLVTGPVGVTFDRPTLEAMMMRYA